MAKMSFEEFLQMQEAYKKYLGEEKNPEPAAEVKEEPKKEEPAPKAEEAADEPDLKQELEEVRKQLAIMAKALSPSLGDVQPVGIDDVVKKFFTD